MQLKLPFLPSLGKRDGFLKQGGRFCPEEGKSEGRIQGEERRERL